MLIVIAIIVTGCRTTVEVYRYRRIEIRPTKNDTLKNDTLKKNFIKLVDCKVDKGNKN